MQLIGCELQLDAPANREAVVRELLQSSTPPYLVLNTCQRLECFGLDEPPVAEARVSRTWKDREAFERLTRIAAGLESRILGELEVLGQVRDAYRRFRTMSGADDSGLDRVFQDSLALARRARRDSGIDRKLTSLSALAARELLVRIPAGLPVAVVGSGSLAGSTARYLRKNGKMPVRVAGRCPENAMQLAARVGGFGTGLDKLAHLLDGVAGIVTATAAPHPVVYAHHLSATQRPLVIVDLGVPPDCHSDVLALPEVTCIGLKDVEAKALENSEERKERAHVASRVIREGALAWSRKL